MSLNDLAVKYKTDKQVNGHNYVTVYESLFGEFREDTFHMLEIGVCRGASHKMWREWFPNAIIYGVDNNPKTIERFQNEERMVIDYLHQGHIDQLIEYSKKGPWRIIIDDGSHMASHQKQTFEVLWGQVEPGGYYIIEDTHTSYTTYALKKSARTPEGGNKWIDSDETLMDKMLQITDEVCRTPYNAKAIRSYFVQGNTENLTTYQREIESIEFRVGMVILKKRGGSNSR